MAYSAIFAVLVGLGMIGHWSFSHLSKQIPEVEDEPIRIGFHIAAEMLTALSLIVSGIALYTGEGWAGSAYLVSIGMLLYTAIVSPGYFAQKGDWKWTGIFAVLIVAGIVSLIPVI
jgi:peptidoglycan/LPS O-acetylase OafA/YrhL